MPENKRAKNVERNLFIKIIITRNNLFSMENKLINTSRSGWR